MQSPRKVFLSYRSLDRDRVRTVAEALRAHGIDAWWDVWEIRPGENVVSKINDGLEQCECGVVFLSEASLAGAWHQDEITILKTFAVDEKRPLIPVLLDSSVKVPAILRPYSRLSADQIDELADAILHRAANKPPLGPARVAPTRVLFSIHLRELPNHAIGVSAHLNGAPLVPEQAVTPGADFAFSYSDFLQAHVLHARLDPPEIAAAGLERDLLKLGDAVGRVVFANEIDRELSAQLDAAAAAAIEIELVFEAAGALLLSIPFEAARLSDGRIPALLPGVFAWRRTPRDGKPTTRKPPSPGPLKILVAVGAPDEGKTPNSVLDIERELQTILDAVEKARTLGNAYVRVLEVASPDQIGAALRELSYHVLHISGHGNQGVLELEDEDGNPVPATAQRLAEKIRDSGHPAPLIVLASCHSGRGDTESASFAQALLENGVPAVLAMQTAVSDYYATELAGCFYEELARAEEPRPSRALALARRELEQRRKNTQQALPENARIPEYATPSLFLRGDEQSVLDRAADLLPAPDVHRTPASGAVPMLSIGDLIGRRKEARQIVAVLTDDPKSIAAIGRKAGCQILGSGGVGKSSLAGRVMQRLSDRGWPIATVAASWNISEIATQLAAVLWDHPQKDLQALARNLGNPDAPDELRLAWLQAIFANHRVLLVLDNFEDVLTPTPTGAVFRDPVATRLFHSLLASAQSAKFLVTSRYPAPGAEDRLYRIDLGPLSIAETRKLMLRHEGLKRQSSENVKIIERAIGGHPRTLEYLDALLRSGRARLETVQDRLTRFAQQAGIALAPDASFEQHVRDAIQVAAADAMVAELVRIVGQDSHDLALLWQASVFPFPVPAQALASDAAPDAAAIRRLAASSLLTPLEENHVYVHRWTAESLKPPLMPEDTYKTCCLHAAEYLQTTALSGSSKRAIAELTESVRLLLAAQAFDDAGQIAGQLIGFLEPRGQTILCTDLARELASTLPETHDYKSAFVSKEADGLLALGLRKEAEERYSVALQLQKERVGRQPQRADYLYNFAVCCDKVGDVKRALGDTEASRQFYEESLGVYKRLVEQDPEDANYIRALSVSYDNMGELYDGLADGEAAREFYEKALALRARLVNQEPGSADYLHLLSVSYERMGDLHGALGDVEEARQFYAKKLELNERLVKQEPGRADYLRDLSISFQRLGDLQLLLDDSEAARQLYAQSLQIIERAVQQEPGRADYITDLARSLLRTGNPFQLRRALRLLEDLQRTNRLSKADETLIAVVQDMINRAENRSAR